MRKAPLPQNSLAALKPSRSQGTRLPAHEVDCGVLSRTQRYEGVAGLCLFVKVGRASRSGRDLLLAHPDHKRINTDVWAFRTDTHHALSWKCTLLVLFTVPNLTEAGKSLAATQTLWRNLNSVRHRAID